MSTSTSTTFTLAPDIAYDYRLLPSATVVFERGDDGEGVLDLQCDDDDAGDQGANGSHRDRLFAWCRLVAQKGVWSPGGTYDPCAAIPTEKPASRTCVLFGLPALTAPRRDFYPADVCDEAVVKTRGFMDPAKTFLHTLHEAWVLAGIEAAAADQKVCTSDVFCRATAQRCAVAICLQQRVAHITRYAPWVGINFPVHSTHAGHHALSIDFLYMARDGLLHACILNMGGSAIRTGREDILEGLVRICGLQQGGVRVHVASLRVSYPLRNESVVVDTSAWSADRLVTVLRTGMRAWNADDYAVFVYCTARSAEVRHSDGSVDEVATTDDLWDAAAGRRIVTWRYVDFAGPDRRFDNDVFELDDGGLVVDGHAVRPTSATCVRQLYLEHATHALHTIGFLRAATPSVTAPGCTLTRQPRD